jgi:hypothetical protein
MKRQKTSPRGHFPNLGESFFRGIMSYPIFRAKIPVQNDENPVPRSPQPTLKECRPGREYSLPF